MGKAIGEMSRTETAATKMAKVGKAAFLGLSVAAVAIGTESVKMAANFDQAMELIHTQAGASQAEVEQLKNDVLKLAPAVGMGPEKLAEGLYHVESAGFRGKAALEITAAAAKDAAIGMGDMDTVSQALIGTMASGIGGVKGAADAAAYLNQIVGIGDMRMQKLAAAVSTGILPSFRSAGLQMNDFGASLATITDNATPADEAATRLRMTVSLMAAPSGKAVKALASIGIGATQLADDMRKPDGLLTAVMDLKTHLEKAGLSASQQNQVIMHAFGGGRTSGAILTLLEESDRLKDKYKELGTSSSRAATYQDAWAHQQQQFTQQMHQLGAEAQVIGIKIGNFLIPKLQTMALWLAKHIEVVKVLAVAIGGVLVAAMAAWTYAVIENTVAMLADPMTWIILGIVAAVALLAVGIYELVKHWGAVWAWIKRISLDVWHALVVAWDATWKAIKAVGEWIYHQIILPIVHFFNDYLVKPIAAYLRLVVAEWKFAWGFLSVVVGDFVTIWKAEWKIISDVVAWVWRFLKGIFDAVNRFGFVPLMAVVHGFVAMWKLEWHLLGEYISVWWGYLKTIFGFVVRYGFDFIKDELLALEKTWSLIWTSVKDQVLRAWHFIKPIFDAIGGAIGSILKAPGSAGSAVAHLLGFAEGGPVPGASGEPQLAIVHGGEFILSQDMIRSLKKGSGAGGTTALPAMAARAGAQTIVVHSHNHVYLDGKQLVGALAPSVLQYTQRNGFSPFVRKR